MHLNRILSRRRGQSRSVLALAAAGILAMGLATVIPAQAVDDPNIFELEGNATDEAVHAGDDWENILDGTDSSLATTGIIPDPAGETIFTGGSTKDDLDISGWLHSTGSVPHKNEITNAYAAAYDDGGDLAIYFGLDKFSVNGNSNVGFWFLQESIPEPLPADGTFGISHEVGDVLVLSEYTNGGAVSAIAVYEWVGSGGDTNGTLNLLASDANANCEGTHNPNACGISNQGADPIPSPWPYEPKSGPNDEFAKGAFFEGGVNLSNLFPSGTPCFSSFMAETRSSQSVDAVLKDFAFGSFPLCDAAIQIDGSAVNEVGDEHTFTVTAQQILGGSASPAVDGTSVDVDLTAANGAVVNVIDDNCAADPEADPPSPGTIGGTCTVTFDSDTAGTITGHASATIMVGDTEIDVETDGTGDNSGEVVKRFVDARVGIDPDDTNGIEESHTFTVTAEMNLGDGSGWVAATTGDVVATLSDAGGAVNSVSANTCGTAPLDGANDDVLDASGQCSVTFTSNSAGTVTGHADAEILVSTAQGDIVLARSTNGAAGNTDDAVKIFLDGQLRWLKVDDLGNPLGGATFEVCRTHDWNSATASFDDVTDVCTTGILDNAAPDSDPDDGEFQLDDLVLGRYVITETAAPTGFQLDDTPQTVDLSTLATNGQAANAFVNPALFKVIVLTCNTSTEQLVVSEVDEDPASAGGVKDTLGGAGLSEAEQAAICGLGGASYDNRTRATHRYDVTIPKP